MFKAFINLDLIFRQNLFPKLVLPKTTTHGLGLKTSIQTFDAFVKYRLMGNHPWPQIQSGIRERSIKSFNNKRFKEFISDIYPKELTISETTEAISVASYLDLLFIRDNSNNITTKLDDKRDTFGFHIVNFPFMSSNIPSAPAYGVYASQLIRYARCCSNYSDSITPQGPSDKTSVTGLQS